MTRFVSDGGLWPMVLGAILLLQPELVRAQTLVGSPFAVAEENPLVGLAGAPNGDVLTLLSLQSLEHQLDVLRLRDGGPGATADGLVTTDRHLTSAVTTLTGDQGWVAAWVLESDDDYRNILAERIGRDGRPTGVPFPVVTHGFMTKLVALAPLGAGFVAVWNDYPYVDIRAFDAAGAPLGLAVHVVIQSVLVDLKVFAIPEGFLVAWRDPHAGAEARLLDTTLTPLAPEHEVANVNRMEHMVVNAAGTQVAVLSRNTTQNTVYVEMFAPDGSAMTEATIPSPGSGIRIADLVFAPNGDLLVLWVQETAIDEMRISGSVFAPSGNPRSPLRPIADVMGGGNGVYATRRADSDFTLAWSDYPLLRGARVTLCEPGTAVCGDGTIDALCEVCDAGSGNSDTLPDQCRLDCRPARCGDGVIDGGEQCDDGNRSNCDGCDEFCEPEVGAVCGDGLVAPLGCAEQCDDANTIAGHGCSPTCQIERIFGGGSPRTDCYAVWRVDNPSNTPFLDRRGAINARQRCRDGDLACDFDGGTPGSCTFHVAVCVNSGDLGACTPARVRTWSILKPSVTDALKHPELGAVRTALSTIPGTIVGAGNPNVCSPDVDVVVPLRGGPGGYKAGKVALKTVAELYDGSFDVDGLQLRCDP